jgi:thiosulfate dehydrogenase
MLRKILSGLFVAVILINVSFIFKSCGSTGIGDDAMNKDSTAQKEWRPWEALEITIIPYTEKTKDANLILYGRSLIANTSGYLGPNGKVQHISNGMNCQNCHLEAGSKPWGNNYGAVSSTYPKFRDRSGSVETIEKRVNDCIERSLNGSPLDPLSHEMKAIVAYIHWLGKNVPKGKRPLGTGITNLEFLDRAADPVQGQIVYINKCQRCHGADGGGQMDLVTGIGYMYPPLWGNNSYNTGAGLFRISRLAGYVKDNMPFGASHLETQVTDEEAWDVAAFVNSQPRPSKEFIHDWPDISTKPFDHPFGPYADSFSEQQHKFGPFKPIQKAKTTKNSK